MHSIGVVAQAPADWTHSQIMPVFSVCAMVFGLTTGGLGSWVEKVGPRMAGTVGSVAWASALAGGGIALHFHSLPLLYASYGICGGIGWGMMYLSPVSSVMKWFPDRRGMATGITLSAFGAGAALAPMIIDAAVSCFFLAPTLIGSVADVALTTLPNGAQVIAQGSLLGTPGMDVVVATASDAGRVGLKEGVYALGTGDSGVARAALSLGALYGAVGITAARFTKLPVDGWKPKGFEPDQTSTAGTQIGLTVEQTMRTPQFALLWLTVFGNAVGGVALISSSKLMMTEIFAGAMPLIVTSAFATTFTAAVGAANAAGRLGWAVASDWLGRRRTFMIYALGIPVMAGVPYLTHHIADGAHYLAIFYGGSILAISFYGGIFSVLPAYIADLFGQKHSGAIHGRALTAWAASAVAGPMGLAWLRRKEEMSAIDSLIQATPAHDFQKAFGVSIDKAGPLIETKTVTIKRLMEIAPDGTVDPTPFLYDTTFLIASGMLGVAAVCNLLLRPPNVAAILAEAEKAKKP